VPGRRATGGSPRQQALDLEIPPPPVLGGGGDLYAYEKALCAAGYDPVAGADEAGRGACAGPLVAAAVILPADLCPTGLNDSKLMTARARDHAYEEIVAAAVWAVVAIPAAEVDRIGVQQANYSALRRAVADLTVRPALALFDGFSPPAAPIPGQTPIPGHAVIKGDRLAACISAASVIAKVTRDRIMAELDREHPDYGFAMHKGYSTRVHQAALDKHGPCAQHRLSYANVPKPTLGDSTPRRGTAPPNVGQNGEGGRRAVQGELLDFGPAAGGTT
jgi:ribonuclease HII